MRNWAQFTCVGIVCQYLLSCFSANPTFLPHFHHSCLLQLSVSLSLTSSFSDAHTYPVPLSLTQSFSDTHTHKFCLVTAIKPPCFSHGVWWTVIETDDVCFYREKIICWIALTCSLNIWRLYCVDCLLFKQKKKAKSVSACYLPANSISAQVRTVLPHIMKCWSSMIGPFLPSVFPLILFCTRTTSLVFPFPGTVFDPYESQGSVYECMFICLTTHLFFIHGNVLTVGINCKVSIWFFHSCSFVSITGTVVPILVALTLIKVTWSVQR